MTEEHCNTVSQDKTGLREFVDIDKTEGVFLLVRETLKRNKTSYDVKYWKDKGWLGKALGNIARFSLLLFFMIR